MKPRKDAKLRIGIILGLVLVFVLPVSCYATNGVEITDFKYDAPGDDHRNLNGEQVEINNSGYDPVDMTGWTLSDENYNHEYVFPPFTLFPGYSVTVFTGHGTNTATELYMGEDQAVWNNEWDCATLRDRYGNVVSYQCTDRRHGITFDYNSTTEGNISPVEVTPGGRIVPPYHSYYSNIITGKSGIFERTAALEGQFKSKDLKHVETEIYYLGNVTIETPRVNWTIYYFWILSRWEAKKEIDYSGIEISDRDYATNAVENITTIFQYNPEFSKVREFSSPMKYDLDTHTTGTADIRYNQFRDGKIEIDEQTYTGDFNVSWKRRIPFDSGLILEVYNKSYLYEPDSWLNCCFDEGLNDGRRYPQFAKLGSVPGPV